MLDTVCTPYDDRTRLVALSVPQATGINCILLFGSRAQGDYGPASDIDSLVVHPEDRAVADLFKLESMERALHARGEFRTLQRLVQKGEMERYDSRIEFNLAFGRAAQGALEHALKALIASTRAEYARIHDLVALQTLAMESMPEFQGLKSPESSFFLRRRRHLRHTRVGTGHRGSVCSGASRCETCR